MDDLQNRLAKIEQDLLSFKTKQIFFSNNYSLYYSEITIPQNTEMKVQILSVVEFKPFNTSSDYLVVARQLPIGATTYGKPNRWRIANNIASAEVFRAISTTPGKLEIIKTEREQL